MAEPITFKSFLAFSTSQNALHNIATGYLVGSNIWMSFIGGIVIYKTVPRHTFGLIQSKLFPVYFGINSAVSSLLLAHHLYLNNASIPATWAGFLASFGSPSGFNTWVLLAMTTASLLNQIVIGPLTTKIMQERHRLDRKEGKQNEAFATPGQSPAMAANTKKFMIAHSCSSIANLIFLGGALVHQAYIGRFGLVWSG